MPDTEKLQQKVIITEYSKVINDQIEDGWKISSVVPSGGKFCFLLVRGELADKAIVNSLEDEHVIKLNS